MSNSATFEFRTSLEQKEVFASVSSLWKKHGYHADVYVQPDFPDVLFCTLEYFFGASEEPDMLKRVLRYLHKISADDKIYYYRCADFVPFVGSGFPILEINVDDLFTAEFSPSIGASIERKYLLSPGSIMAI